jgi:retron-type reverse transcriptase
MNLRIGYVNVRGLSRASWEACNLLLSHRLDYLFVAETWFVNHQIYSRDRRFIASTNLTAKNLQGRQRGGIYLLGSHHARSKVDRVDVTEHSITFRRGKHSFSGVYFPPTTMDINTLTMLLDSLRHSTVILGDINTRFHDPLYQAGEPGPPERLRVFNNFISNTGHQHIKPSQATQIKLTTDHCFVWPQQTASLQLLNNSNLRMETDHRYTLSLTLGPRGSHETVPAETIQRFRVSQMSNPQLRERMVTLINQHTQVFDGSHNIEEMHTKLVEFCQQVQERTIGKAKPEHSRKPRRDRLSCSEQTIAASIRLYKQASQVSDENDVIFPTREAQSQGVDALTENLNILKQRWSGRRFQEPVREAGRNDIESWTWTREQVVAEIEQQESDKSCGADGIHIQFLKAVKDTAVVLWLLQLYNQCLCQGRTPREWNRSEIYLLSKDVNQRRDAKNLRPISIICIFRKVFERLLLLQFQGQPWAQFHPAQAGFRRSYSTYTNAAVVHALLASKTRSTVVFLDFKSAFDVVDHQRLDDKLAARGCPASLRLLIQSLMFVHLSSRILINGQVTEWFPRTCGAPQGSPLSPWLFNIFIDDLLYQVNADTPGIPVCLFYADDGAIIANSKTDVGEKLRIVEDWTIQNAIFLNPAKCGVITSRSDLPPLCVYGQEIPRAESYAYLGFPVSAGGIDFPKHLKQRIQAAAGRARWLGAYSNPWGPAHRLRIYKQFLAPMFEYGAPLVWAWARENPQHQEAFHLACSGFKDLMSWISNTSDSRHLVTANLCGLSTPGRRFQRLSTAYQLIVEQMDPGSPLKQLLAQPNSYSSLQSFAYNLGNDPGYASFKETSNFEPTVRTALARFLRAQLRLTIHTEALSSQLTSLIPIESRKVPGLLLADISLAAPVPAQSMLLQYRRGVFMLKSVCACDPEVRFYRGHETCAALNLPLRLTRREQYQKRKMQSKLPLIGSKFTELDYLLNSGQLKHAICILVEIQKQLRQVYKATKAMDSMNS